MIGRPRAYAIGLTVAGALGWAGWRLHTPAPAPVWRWIPSAAARELTARDAQPIDCVRRYAFDGGRIPPDLELAAGRQVETSTGRLWLRGEAAPARLAIQRTFAENEIDAVRVDVNGLEWGSVQLIWHDLRRGSSGSLFLPRPAGVGPARNRYVFRLPWPMEARFEVIPSTRTGETVAVDGLCFGTTRPPASLVAELSRTPWKVSVGEDVRDAFVLPASGKVARSGTLPGHARLTFGVGRAVGDAESIRVLTALTSGGTRQILLDRIVRREELDRGWADCDVDLASFAGRSVDIEIAVRARGAAPEFAAAVSAPRVFDAGAPRDPRPNIVLVSIDTLRADHLSLYGYARRTSPRLDGWAREHAAVFRRVVTPATWTLPSHVSLFTGMDAFAHASNHGGRPGKGLAEALLAERLHDAGYRTQAFTGGGYVASAYGLAQGFEAFHAWSSPKKGFDTELAGNLERAHRFLDHDEPSPFFLFLHTYEVHAPNGPREPWYSKLGGRTRDGAVSFVTYSKARFAPAQGLVTRHFVAVGDQREEAKDDALVDDEYVRGTYDSSIAYVDEQLAPLLERLRRPPFRDDTVVAVVSDHGESLGEHGLAGHGYLGLDNLLVPMLIALPDGRGRGRMIETQVRTHDLYPTLLELAGLPVPAGIDARTLRPLIDGQAEPGRVAYSYAATTNYGLAVVTPEGDKVEWRNAPWRSEGGGLLWSKIDGFQERAVDRPSGPESARLERALERVYSDRASGIRVELRSTGRAAVDVELRSSMIRESVVKLAAHASVPAAWTEHGRLQTHVDADRPLLLNFESAARAVDLDVAVRRADCAQPARLSIRASAPELHQLRREELTPAGCAAGPFGPPVELRLYAHGTESDPGVSPEGAAREQLRALGYVN